MLVDMILSNIASTYHMVIVLSDIAVSKTSSGYDTAI